MKKMLHYLKELLKRARRERRSLLPASLILSFCCAVIAVTAHTRGAIKHGHKKAYRVPASAKIAKPNITGPTVSYSSPQVYKPDVAIAPLTPTSSGVAAPGYSNNPSNFYTVAKPSCAVVDQSGNLFYSSSNGVGVAELPKGATTPIGYGTGIGVVADLAVDGRGNLFVASTSQSEIIEIAPNGGAQSVVGSGFNAPQAVAVDSAGNVYIADTGNGMVKEVPSNGAPITALGSGFNSPSGIAVDAQGNVYVGDFALDEVFMIPAGNGTPVSLGSGFNNPRVAVDPEGNVFVSDYVTNKVTELHAGGGPQVNIASGFNRPLEIQVDNYGNLYVTDQNNNEIKEITPTGGFFINAVPQGLFFNNTTGVLSGTPVSSEEPTQYTVTAYGSGSSTTANFTISVNPLSLSYNSPQVYTQGQAISTLNPTASGYSPFGYNGNSVSIAPGSFNTPTGVAVDAAGNIYVADWDDGVVKKIPVGGGAPVLVGSGFSKPSGVAIDPAGNIYISDSGAGTISKIPVGGGSMVTIATRLSIPMGIAVDGSGNVYVAEQGNSLVQEILAGGGTLTLGPAFSHPNGVAVDSFGNVYVADTCDNAVVKIPVNNGPPVAVGSGYDQPTGVAVDGAGNVYVADNQHYAIDVIPVGTNTPMQIGEGGTLAFGICVDSKGNVYNVDDNNAVNTLFVTQPSGGFFISPFLPTALSFNSSTGAISGAPSVSSPATDYTVTAWNAYGNLSANLNITVNPEPAPSISYTSPHTYSPGIAIATLTPTTSHSSILAYNLQPTPFGTGVGFPFGVTTDAAGNVYVADYTNNAVEKIPAGGGAAVAVATGLNGPSGVAVDVSGNIYVSNYTGNQVEEIPVGGGTPIILGSGFSSPGGLAVDGAGNLYVADSGNNAVKEIPAGNGTPIILGSGFLQPFGVAVDVMGNVYVADNGNNAVKKIPAGNGTPTVVLSGLQQPYGVAIDPGGDIFVADVGDNAVRELVGGSGSPVTLGEGFSEPTSASVDPAGLLYVADVGNAAVKKMVPLGGFFINSFLPKGLSFNRNTGAISGTPTANSPATNYTVTAWNPGGSGSAVVNIAVVPNANLSALKFSGGTLSPTFASGTTTYTSSVTNGTLTITVTPTTSDPAATVKVNGTAVVSGTASGAISLNVGANVIPVVVTASDGVTNKTYTVTITRAPSSNATLKSLSLTAPYAALTTVTGPDFRDYTASVANTVTSIEVVPTTTDANATLTINGNAATSGSASSPVSLAVGPNAIKIVVTGQDGVTKDTYVITVTRAPSSNALLSALSLTSPNTALTTVTGPDYKDYTASVPNTATSIKVVPTTASTAATVTVNGTTVTSGMASAPIPLVVGPNPITVVCTAQDGVTKDTYVITVTRPKSSDATLSSLSLTSPYAALTTVTGTDYKDYTASVASTVSSIEVLPTTNEPNATLTINGNVATSGSASSPIPLVAGPNSIKITVTAQDGVTKKTYAITVTRAKSSNASLSSLSLTSPYAALTTVTGPDYKDYTASVANTVASIKVLATTADPTATITVNGTATPSGTASAAIPLAVGANTITTVCTAQDGVTTHSYVITVTRAGPVASLDQVSVAQPTETPLLADDGINVHKGVSPNGDGIEDFLQIDNIAQYPDNHLAIMNRNGQLVYEAKGYDNSTKIFDGHNNKTGRMQLPGTYFFSLDYTVNGVIKHQTGFLVLKY